jgi:uncharacterized protein (DUF2141 family)
MNTIKQLSMILIMFLANSNPVFGQHHLVIEISPLKNDNGKVLLAFMDENENIIREISADIDSGQCTVLIENLEPGNYAFKYFHDENENNKLDTKLFIIPKEGYGFSNNAKGRFGPPSFKDTIFELTMNDTLLCKPVY